jgi:hypothetical protein
VDIGLVTYQERTDQQKLQICKMLKDDLRLIKKVDLISYKISIKRLETKLQKALDTITISSSNYHKIVYKGMKIKKIFSIAGLTISDLRSTMDLKQNKLLKGRVGNKSGLGLF